MENPTPEITLDEKSAKDLGRLNLRRLWKDASWTTGSLAVGTLLALVESVLLARYLGAAGLGLFVLIRAFPEGVQQILDCRTGETVIKYLGEFVALEDRERAHAIVRLIWLVDAAAAVIAVAIVLATASVAARYVVHDPTVAWLVAVYAVSQFANTLDSASGSVVRIFDRFGLASVMGVCRAVAHFLGILLVLVLGGGISALIYLLVGVEVVYSAAATLVALWLLRERIGFRIRGTTAILGVRRREILKFLLNTNLTGTLKMSADKIAVIIIGAMGSAVIAAQFKIASQVGSSLLLFSAPLYQVVYPSLSRMVARRQWGAVFGGLRRLQRVMLAATIPLAAVICGLMVPLLPIVFGQEFTEAVIPGIVIVWAVVPPVVFFWRRPLLLSLGQSGRLTQYRAIASAIQLAMTVLLVRPVGALGAALALVVMHWLYTALEIRLASSWRKRLLHEEPGA
jgi:O-antigen/teichoic acid export membrane protein